MMQVLLPQLGFSMEEGQVVSWLVEDGAEVSAGQILYEMEGDKAVQEVEAPASGRLRILAPTGVIFPVGSVLAEIV
jgi:pyruvate/2-oxoglutarate dehydrogenase complex dihydrolipoamide acyltransferase (E2) component